MASDFSIIYHAILEKDQHMFSLTVIFNVSSTICNCYDGTYFSQVSIQNKNCQVPNSILNTYSRLVLHMPTIAIEAFINVCIGPPL